MSYRNNSRRQILVAVREEMSRVVSNHLLNIFAQSIRSIQPAYGNRFKKGHPQHGNSASTVQIEQLEEINAALRK